MPNTDENKVNNNIIAFAILALVLAIVGTATVLYYLGMFSSVTVTKTTSPAYRLAYFNHTGPYNDIQPVFDSITETLQSADIETIAPCAVFLDDPSIVSESALRSKIGFLVPWNSYLPGNIEDEEIPSREIIQARFRGSPIVGSFKAYKAMKQWSADHGYALNLPAVEIYHDNGEVEYQLPIQPLK